MSQNKPQRGVIYLATPVSCPLGCKMPFCPSQRLSELGNPHVPPGPPIPPPAAECHGICHGHRGFSTQWELRRTQKMDQNEQRKGGWSHG